MRILAIAIIALCTSSCNSFNRTGNSVSDVIRAYQEGHNAGYQQALADIEAINQYESQLNDKIYQ